MRKRTLLVNSNHRAPQSAQGRWLGSLAAVTFFLAATFAIAAATNTGGVQALGVGVADATWTTGAPMPVARSSSASASVNGILYAAGGHDGTSMTSEVYAYDPASNSWAARMAMPGPRYAGNGAAEINGKLYVAGGWTTYPYAPLPNSNLWEYDPAANTWSTRASMPILSACGASAAINGKLYVATACDGYSGYRNYLHVWDPANDTWTQLAGSQDAHAWSSAVGVINGKLYLSGGTGSSEAITAMLEVYDPVSNTWTTLAPMPTPRNGTSSAVVNGKLYVTGGTTANGAVTGVVESYDPQSDSWSTVSELPTARSQMASGALGNVIYFAGGSNGTSTVGVTEAMQLSVTSDTTTTAASTTTTSASSATTTTLAGGGSVTLNFIPGWNLVGNSASGTIDVPGTFGDAAKVTTVWKWIAPSARWAFYSPLADASYAQSKGYDHLTTIGGGEGFWVNARSAFTAQLPAGSTITSASFQGIAPGWSLIAVGDNPTPSEFNKTLSLTRPAAGDIPLNVTTLWAWDAARMNWYFYAPSLEKNGTLAAYIASKNYLDFGTKTLDPATGFWVNVPADTSGNTTTTTTSTTTTVGSTTTTTTIPGTTAFHVDISLTRGTVTFPNKYSGWTVGGDSLTNYVAIPSGWSVGGTSLTTFLAIPPGWSLGGAPLTNFVAVPPGWSVGGSSTGCFIPIPPGWSLGGAPLTNFVAVPPGWSAEGSSTSQFLALPPGWTLGGSALTNWVAVPPGWSIGGASTTNFVGLAPGWTSGGSSTTNFVALPPGWTLGGSPPSNYIALPPGWVVGGSSGTNYVAYPSDSVTTIEVAFNDPGHLAMFLELQSSGQYTEEQLADIVMATYLNGATFWRWQAFDSPRFNEPSGMWLGAKYDCATNSTTTTTSTTTTITTTTSSTTSTTAVSPTTTTTSVTTTTTAPTTTTTATTGSTMTTTGATTTTTAPTTTTTTTTTTTAPTTTTTVATTTTTLPAIMLTTQNRACSVNTFCSVSLVSATTGGNPPYHYQMDSFAYGTPPMGMTLGTDGVLSGTPSVLGTYTFSFCAVDLSGNSDCEMVSVTVGIGGAWAGTWTVTSPAACNTYAGTWNANFVEQANGQLGGTWQSSDGAAGQLGGQRNGANAIWNAAAGGVTFNGNITGTNIAGAFNSNEHCYDPNTGADLGPVSGTFNGAKQ